MKTVVFVPISHYLFLFYKCALVLICWLRFNHVLQVPKFEKNNMIHDDT